MFESQLIQLHDQFEDKKDRKRLRDLYKKFLSEMGCILTEKRTVHLHHLRLKGTCGTGIKPNNLYMIPLYFELHLEGHSIGWKSFEEKYSCNLESELLKLHNKFIQRIK